MKKFLKKIDTQFLNGELKLKKNKCEFFDFLKYIKSENKNIMKPYQDISYSIDAFDFENNSAIKFQNDEITKERILHFDSLCETDWIFNVQGQNMKLVEIGGFVVCEIPNGLENSLCDIKENVFLYTGNREWIWLVDRDSYTIEVDRKKFNVWIGEICSFKDVLENSCLQNVITEEGLTFFNGITKEMERIQIVYARCKKSMYFLDDIHRNYVNNHVFKSNDIIAIKSVAGSGKTTTLLTMSQIHKSKKILYIAFNKSLILEIKDKIKTREIKNMFAHTFDALLYNMYSSIKGCEPDITDLRPQNIGKIIPFFEGKPYKLKKYYCDKFIEFCNDHEYNDMKEFCENRLNTAKPLLEQLWENCKQGNITTFETIRKEAYINKWFKNYIDKNYNMIMIDETQDFDMIMLRMLLDDTTIPKIFVGDPKQAIYEFRGCINAFNYMTSGSLILEFYSTFRVGNPACDIIRGKFKECWMVSKSKNNTEFVSSSSMVSEPYVYLFRSWRVLLQTAENSTKSIWIYGYDKKINDIRYLHKKVSNKYYKIDDDEDEYEDDLPKFLSSLSAEDLEEMLTKIGNNVVSFKDSYCKMYTVHSYKGMEHDNIRIACDVDIEKEENIYYVALTRGMKKIFMD